MHKRSTTLPPLARAVVALMFITVAGRLAAAQATAPASDFKDTKYLGNVVSVACLLDSETGELRNIQYTTGGGKSLWVNPSGPTAASPTVDRIVHDLRLAGSIDTVLAGYTDTPAPTWYVTFGTTEGVFRTCGVIDRASTSTPKVLTRETAPKGKGLQAISGVKCSLAGVCEGLKASWGGKQLLLADAPTTAGCPVNSEQLTFDPATHGSCAALAAAGCYSLAELRLVNGPEVNIETYCASLKAGDKLCVPAWRCCGAGLHKVTYHPSLGASCGKVFKTLGVSKTEFLADNPGVTDYNDYCKLQLRSGVTTFCARNEPTPCGSKSSKCGVGNAVTCPAGSSLVTYTADMGYCFSILDKAGISQAQFLAINTWITDYNNFCTNLLPGITTFCLPSGDGCPQGSYRVTWQKSYGLCADMQQKWGLDKATFEKYNTAVTYDAFCSGLQDGATKFCLANGVGPGPNPPTPIPRKRIFLYFSGGWAGGSPPALSSLPNADGVNLFVAGYFAVDRKNPDDDATGNYDWFDTYQKGYPFSYSKNQVLNWKATAPTGTTRKFVISVNGDQYYWKMPSIGVNAWVKNAVASLTKLMDTYGMDGVEWNIENFKVGSPGFVDATCGVFQGLKAANPNTVVILDTYQWVDLGQTLPVYQKCKDSIDFLNYQTYGGAFEAITSDVNQWLSTADTLIFNRWPADVVPKLIFSFSTALPACPGAPNQRGIVDPAKAAQVTTAMMNKGAAGAFTWTAEWSTCAAWQPAFALESAVQNVIKAYA